MSAVVDRVACPECGAQKSQPCEWVQSDYGAGAFVTYLPDPHLARREALWAANRRRAAANVNDRSTP